MLRLDHVGRVFGSGHAALRDIDLLVTAGEFVVLLGPSGCGKSTLLRLVAGLDQPTGGTITWSDGKPASGHIGFVFQDANLLPWASARDNVALPLRLAGGKKAAARVAAEAALDRVGLGEAVRLMPRELSGGMRMRVSLARALVQRPRLLLMDEPFAALDEFTRHRLQEDLRRLWQDTGTSILFVTHSIDEACFLASRVILMHAGGIMADCVSPALLSERSDPLRLAFVASLARQLALAAAA